MIILFVATCWNGIHHDVESFQNKEIYLWFVKYVQKQPSYYSNKHILNKPFLISWNIVNFKIH